MPMANKTMPRITLITLSTEPSFVFIAPSPLKFLYFILNLPFIICYYVLMQKSNSLPYGKESVKFFLKNSNKEVNLR